MKDSMQYDILALFQGCCGCYQWSSHPSGPSQSCNLSLLKLQGVPLTKLSFCMWFQPFLQVLTHRVGRFFFGHRVYDNALSCNLNVPETSSHFHLILSLPCLVFALFHPHLIFVSSLYILDLIFLDLIYIRLLPLSPSSSHGPVHHSFLILFSLHMLPYLWPSALFVYYSWWELIPMFLRISLSSFPFLVLHCLVHAWVLQ